MEAVALPIVTEADSELRRFTIGKRLTPHVRHRQKYVDVPVVDKRAFVFRIGGGSTPLRAHTLREFVAVLTDLGLTEADEYLRRSDFSRWIEGVFGDHALARELHRHERAYVQSKSTDTLEQIASAIESRYDLMHESDAAIA
jgi:hypothetical protein